MALNRVRFNGEAKHASRAARGEPKTQFAHGGRVHGFPKMTAGAGSGEGRLQKTKAYGIPPKGGEPSKPTQPKRNPKPRFMAEND